MKKLKVVLGLTMRENDFQQQHAAVAEATAQRLGIELTVVYGEGDAIAQTKQILALIHGPKDDRPSAVIVEPIGTGMLPVATAAVNNGVGWVVLSRKEDYLLPLREKAAVPVGSFATDNKEAGRIQGRQFAALLPGGGTLLYIEGPATDPARLRREGLQETLPKNIEIRTAAGKWTEASGYQAMASRLQAGTVSRGIHLIGCQNDAMALGARRALEELPADARREEWLRVPFTGVDGVPATGQQWVQKGLLAATVVIPPLTGLALEALARSIASGEQLPERTFTVPVSYPPVEQLKPRMPAAG
ncbi:MAG TPA: substrate-binding domain-containing protein [Longimicrobiales bacterium]